MNYLKIGIKKAPIFRSQIILDPREISDSVYINIAALMITIIINWAQ
jgi:hypothetical protein